MKASSVLAGGAFYYSYQAGYVSNGSASNCYTTGSISAGEGASRGQLAVGLLRTCSSNTDPSDISRGRFEDSRIFTPSGLEH
ncbi:MAG: hypothetical protein U9N81_12120 [Bacillota bacterium]|nr:hypothetical protein [Bacillota bacterium]